MEPTLQQLTTTLNEYTGNWLHFSSGNDLFFYAGVLAVVLIAAAMITMYSIKKAVINLVTGYITLYIVQQFFHIAIVPDYLLLGLMAFFGPLAVIGAALWHTFM